jgi:hypothetical protein
MNLRFAVAKKLASGSLCLGLAMLWTDLIHATETAAPEHDEIVRNLPELPGADNAAPAHFDLNQQRAIVGYGTRAQRWGAKLGEYANLNPSFKVDYGQLLSSTFGAGAAFTHEQAYSEMLVNGVYAPKRNFRLQLTGSQLRASNHYSATSGDNVNSVLQNSYLLDLKRYWDQGKLLSDVGLATYVVEANSAVAADMPALRNIGFPDAGEDHLARPALGRLDGYMLNLGLQPTPDSKIELRRELGHLTYYPAAGARSEEQLLSHRIKYSHYFDNCMRFQGGYSTSAAYDRLDLKVAKNNWIINLSQTQDGYGNATAVQIKYSLSLDGPKTSVKDCRPQPESGRTFERIVDAAVKRPHLFPHEPLTKTDAQ